MNKQNELDEFDELEQLDNDTSDDVPQQDDSGLISEGSAGTVYDYNEAPDYTKAPPRENLDGKEVTINKADIILPTADVKWQPTRKGDKFVKYCPFKLYYNIGGQVEYLSGIRVFKTNDGKYSHPSITKDGKNQASQLMGLYAEFKEKDINEVSLKEFMSFLNSKPKAIIKGTPVTNPVTGQTITKNLVEKFI